MSPSHLPRRPLGLRAPHVAFLLAALASGCGTSAPNNSTQGSGGAPAVGGQLASGGALGSGGTAAGVGGAFATGGVSSSGGAANTGGANASGGTGPVGGTLSGGASLGGGSGSGSGGTSTTGGAGTGGDVGSGGGPAVFSPCPSSGACAILPLGDSITEGFASPGGGYRVEIFRQALAANKDITFVGDLQNGPNMVDGQNFPRKHQGHGGFTIDTDAGHSGISGEITNSAMDDYHPHIVLLMIGTNDINGNVDVQNAPNRLGKLIDSITSRSPDSLVVVASIVPVLNSGTNAKVLTYNASLKQLVEQRSAEGDHVQFLDNYQAIASQPNYSSALMADSLHPNDAGYAVLGQSFFDAIEPVLP